MVALVLDFGNLSAVILDHRNAEKPGLHRRVLVAAELVLEHNLCGNGNLLDYFVDLEVVQSPGERKFLLAVNFRRRHQQVTRFANGKRLFLVLAELIANHDLTNGFSLSLAQAVPV